MIQSIFLLDTNIISELMRLSPEVKLLNWFDENKDGRFFISAITQAEILLGIELLSDGKRKMQLRNAFETILEEDFSNSCLAFEGQSAREYAKIVVSRNKLGRPISVEDAQIASIAITNSLCLVTRNEKDFKGIARLSLTNPWTKV